MKMLKIFLVLVLIGLISFIVLLGVYSGAEQHTETKASTQVVHRVGNLFENINAGGEFASEGRMLYYVADDKLVRSDAFGRNRDELYADPNGDTLDHGNINVLDGWVYWGNASIHKIRTSGTGHRTISFDGGRVQRMYVVDNKIIIYSGDALWSLNTDGTDQKLLFSGEIFDTCMANDCLYFRDAEGHIRYVSLDGAKKGTLYSAGRCSGMHLYNDRLYFVQSGLRSIDLNGKDEVLHDPEYTMAVECGFNDRIFNRAQNSTGVVDLRTLTVDVVPQMQNVHWINNRYLAQNETQTEWFFVDPETYARTVFPGK